VQKRLSHRARPKPGDGSVGGICPANWKKYIGDHEKRTLWGGGGGQRVLCYSFANRIPKGLFQGGKKRGCGAASPKIGDDGVGKRKKPALRSIERALREKKLMSLCVHFKTIGLVLTLSLKRGLRKWRAGNPIQGGFCGEQTSSN